jgi:iron(III) transport system ATP-binding protein
MQRPQLTRTLGETFDRLVGKRPKPAATDQATPSASTPSGRRAAAAFAASLSFRNIEMKYGDFTALHDVSLDIAAGEVVCLLGPSGCGKTSLLRLASGIERPSAGEVLLNNRVVAGAGIFIPPEKRNVGLMFQDFALFPHLTILENVCFGLHFMPKETARQEAMMALARVGLDNYANEHPHTLSGGQQQRVALARALVPRPSIILMDEPFSGLDVQLRETIRSETLALLRETRSTCLLVTHDPDEAMQLGDRIAVMRAGRIIQAGTAQALYHDPSDLFVARLFSQINEIPVTVTGGSISTPFGRYPANDHPDGTRLVMCVRQRAVWVYAADHDASMLAGRVVATRFLGDLVLVAIAINGLDQPITSLVRGDRAPAIGDDVRIKVDPAGVVMFPQSADA